jgi:hypothetical protein
MAEEYTEVSRRNAEQIAATLKQLDMILASDKIATPPTGDITELRGRVRKLLVDINSDLEALANIDRQDVFKTNPVFATQRYQLIRNAETSKIAFEFEILPSLQTLTKRVVEEVKQKAPERADVAALPPHPPGEQWTVQRVVDTAQTFVTQATKAAEVAGKGYALVKALGLLSGVPVP